MAPLVVAHRTCPLQVPDNSLEGIALAREVGADAVEVDIRMSRDGVPFLVHDRTLWRVARLPLPVEVLHSRRVERLRRRTGERFVRLSEALAALPDGLTLMVEVKRGPGSAAIAADIRRAGAEDRVELWCKRTWALRRFARDLPQVRRALLRDTWTPLGTRRLLWDAARLGAHAVSVHWRSVTPQLVAEARRRGLGVYAMTRDLPGQASKSSLLDALITDWPAEAVAWLRSQGASNSLGAHPHGCVPRGEDGER